MVRQRNAECGRALDQPPRTAVPADRTCPRQDLLPAFLPKPPGLPHLENVEIAHRFSPNDQMYHVAVSPWGPFPGADDVHNMTTFDLTEEPEGARAIVARFLNAASFP